MCTELHRLYERMLVIGEAALPSAGPARERTPETEKLAQTPQIDGPPEDPKEVEPKDEDGKEETKEDEPKDEGRTLDPESQSHTQEVPDEQANVVPDRGELVSHSELFFIEFKVKSILSFGKIVSTY